ncbi:MAG: patatin-like phospholipase family protein [Acidimicrobiia bacterium]
MNGSKIGFVLGGGGHRGAFEVGMLKALIEAGVLPDLVVGNSVGAFNGVAVASEPSSAMVEKLESTWLHLPNTEVFQSSLWTRATTIIKHRTHLHSSDPLRQMLEEFLPVRDFSELTVPFQCVAACIEDAAEHWFSHGPLIPAILASSAVPGLLPPVEIGGRHYVDGGVVNSIPISRAVELGTRVIYVMHVGHIDAPLEPPARPWDVAMVAFEIARRHRFSRDMAMLPGDIEVHVLPTGDPEPRYNDPAKLRYSDFSVISERIEQAYAATKEYLAGQ